MKTLKMFGVTLGAIALAVVGAGCQSRAGNDQANSQTDQTTAQPSAVPQSDQTTTNQTNSVQRTAPISDQQFVTEATQSGLAEIALGQLAQQKGASAQVKQYGQQMITDHTQANSQLKTLATKKGLTVPTAPNAQQKATRDRLAGLSGSAFDRAYMQQMEQDHAKAVALFQRESAQGQDSNLKQWASTTLPKLQNHLAMAQRDMANVRKGNQ